MSDKTATGQLLLEYKAMLDNAGVAVIFTRARLTYRCNPLAEALFGWPAGMLIGQPGSVFFPSAEAYRDLGQQARPVLALGQMLSLDILLARRDGSTFTAHLIARAIDPAASRSGTVWIVRDITPERAVDEALRQSHHELEQRVAERTAELSQQLHFMQQLIEAIPGPIFYKDAEARYLGCNSAFANFIGIAAEDLIGKSPYDIAPAELAEKYMAADRALLDQPGWQIYENTVRHADGGMREVVFNKATFTRPDGMVGGLVGFMLDITERKRMEARLQQAATVFDSSAEGVTITAPDGSIIAVNRAFTEITGYREEEVIGRNPRMLQSGRQDVTFYREMWTAIGGNDRWQGEIWNKGKDGRIFPEWLTISAVKNAAGVVTHYVGVFSDITDIKAAQEQLSHQAHHDPLTGLPNRLLLEDRLVVAIEHARRKNSGLAVLLIDVDRFKNINDSLGHQVGDGVLRQIAARLSKQKRASDMIARLGGDEFVIIIEDVESPTAAAQIADKILDNLRETPVTLEQEFFVGASIGISLFPQDGDDSASLIKHADVAMYRAKERGRNTYEFFTPELTHFSLERFQMETDLRRAIERDELRVYLQPQFALHSGKLVGAEALVRWQHPARGLILPGEFIQLAEECGLITALGEWVQRSACHYWAGWAASGRHPGVLSINVSGIEFRRGRIQETLRKTLAATCLRPELLELEITESTVMGQAENSILLLHELRNMGISLAIDDFGTGYSSLAYLKRLPLNKLKVDQSFVHGLPNNAEDCAIARAIIALGHSLQLKIIAEGVESEAQRDFLSREGCDEMQGYLRGRPMPAEEFAKTFLAA